jgi:hypothetical protein
VKRLKTKNMKTDYAASNYWSDLFFCGGDGRTASDGGLAVLGPISIF